MAYNGSTRLASGITQLNGQNYALVDASAVRVDDDTRLNEALQTLNDYTARTVKRLTSEERENVTESNFPFGSYFTGPGNVISGIFTSLPYTLQSSPLYLVESWRDISDTHSARGVVRITLESRTPGQEQYFGYHSDSSGDWTWADISFIPVDDTLSVSGEAADAAAVGDVLDNLGIVPVLWEQGRIGVSGQDVSSSTAIRTAYIPVKAGEIYSSKSLILGGYRANTVFYFYDSTKTYMSNNATGEVPAGAKYMRTHINNGPNGATILPSEGKNYPIQKSPSVIGIETGGAGFFVSTTTGDRVFNVNNFTLTSGDQVFFAPISWDGPAATKYRLYGNSGGSQVLLKEVSEIYEYCCVTVSASYDSLSVGIQCDEFSDSATLKFLLYKNGEDKLTPLAISLGKAQNAAETAIGIIQTNIGSLESDIDDLEAAIGGTFLYSATSTNRAMDIPVEVTAGDRIFCVPIYWDGPTATKFQLYGYNGSNYVDLADMRSLYTFCIYEFTTPYQSLRVGIKCEALSEAATLKVMLLKVGTDNITPIAYSLGQKIEDNIIANRPSNLYNVDTDVVGYAIGADGTISENASYEYSQLIPVAKNTNYILTTYAKDYSTSSRVRILGYDDTDTFVEQIATDVKGSSTTAKTLVCRFTTSGTVSGVRISVRVTNTDTILTQEFPEMPWVMEKPTDTVRVKPLSSFALAGKKLSILGASISSYEGYIPEGNSKYYPDSADPGDNKVEDVHDIYWRKVIDETGMELLVNNSSAGTFCTTGHGTSADAKAGCGDRSEALDDGTTYPDVIIIQLGGNDFTRSTPLGEYDGSQIFPDPTEDSSVTDTFREAYAVMLKRILTKYTGAKILCGTIPVIRGGTYVTSTFPPANKDQGAGKPGGILLEEYNNAIRELASLFGCGVVEFAKCGLTFFNVSTYMQDYTDGYGQHPNKFGHSMMANAVLQALGQAFGRVYPNA